MKKLALFALLVVCIASAPLAAGPREIDISPNPMTSPGQSPQVCVSGFRPGSFVNVMLPAPIPAYGIYVNERITYCYRSDYVADIAPGVYDVPSMVCEFKANRPLPVCKAGPTATLTVE